MIKGVFNICNNGISSLYLSSKDGQENVDELINRNNEVHSLVYCQLKFDNEKDAEEAYNALIGCHISLNP